MGWRLQIEHRTVFRYAGTARTSFNEARMTPMHTSSQTLLGSSLQVLPAAQVTRYTDYWGTLVTAFDLHEPHDRLEVVARSTVETRDVGGTHADASWEQVCDPAVTDRWCELLTPTPRTEIDGDLRAVAAAIAATREPDDAARAVADWVRGEVVYRPGATGVQTAAMEAYHQRSGVCQDLAHLTLGMLRAVGLPARYVSGYLHPVADAEVGVATEGESHAWVEWWAGTWSGYDPTNGADASPRHVVVARGRDYDDVTPLKGIVTGAPSEGLEVSVQVTRIG